MSEDIERSLYEEFNNKGSAWTVMYKPIRLLHVSMVRKKEDVYKVSMAYRKMYGDEKVHHSFPFNREYEQTLSFDAEILRSIVVK
jgi:hypothetical protein